ncbi:MAG: aldo/keto reductase [Mycoplasmatales bacterium]
MIKKIKLGNLECSNIAIGTWRFNEGFENSEQVKDFILQIEKLGINTIDTAQVYGSKHFHYAEQLLSDLLSDAEIRKRFIVVTKSGIGWGDVNQESQWGFYDFSKANLLKGVEGSLKAMQTSYIDLFLLHRPDYFADFTEIKEAFIELKNSGKVKEFGVSNFTPTEFASLNEYLKKEANIELVTNQIEYNPFCTEHIENGNLYFLKGQGISPMIWSPFAGGEVFKNVAVLEELAAKYETCVEEIVLSYIIESNTNPLVIYGSNKVTNYEKLKDFKGVKLNKQEVFKILSTCGEFEIR